MASFVDRVVLHVAAGDGGHGVASVRREKFKPLGGPDGGNGGRGGNVELYVDPQATTLLDYHHSPHRKATNGQPGGGDDRNGADGGDLVLPVPAGTVVKGTDGEVIADLVNLGETFVVPWPLTVVRSRHGGQQPRKTRFCARRLTSRARTSCRKRLCYGR